MSQNDEREAFESWCTDCNEEISFERLPVRKGSTCDWYRDKEVEAMWLAWQARAALSQRAEVPLRLPPLACRHSNRSDCALFGVSTNRPSRAPHTAQQGEQENGNG